MFAIPLHHRFRGLTVREGMLLRGEAGWGEWSPFLEYDAEVSAPWLRCAEEAAAGDWPAPVRDAVPVNVDGAGVGPEQAHRIVLAGGCATAKVKVAEPGQSPADDQARVEAVRDALGPAGGCASTRTARWSVDEAVTAIGLLDKAAGGLEYVEQPAPRSRSSRRCAGRSTCRSRRTSRSGGPPTPTWSATSRRRTSRC